MSEQRMIFCQKLHKEAVGFLAPPLKGEIGQRIFESISVEAFNLWKARQIMLINEYRLNLLDPKSKDFLKEQMKAFLFEDTEILPEGYVKNKEE